MRTIISYVILFSINSFAATEPTLFESRGLMNGKCYRENAKYECAPDCKKCTLHVFPGIKAQLSMPASDLESFCKHHKTDTGLTTFKVNTVKEETSASVLGFIQVRKDLSETWAVQSDLKSFPVPCPKN
jgi:hypothetical protein